VCDFYCVDPLAFNLPGRGQILRRGCVMIKEKESGSSKGDRRGGLYSFRKEVANG
jgi:hypothetical protein